MQAFRFSSLAKTLLVTVSLAAIAGCDLTSEAPLPPEATPATPAPELTDPAAAPNAAAPPANPAEPAPAANPAAPAPAASPAAPAATPAATPPAALNVGTPQPGASPAQPGIAISPATTGQATSQTGSGSGAPTGQTAATAQPIRCNTAAYVAEVSWQGNQPQMTFTRKPSEVVLSNAPVTVTANPDASATYAAAGTSTTYARIFPDGNCFVQVVGGNGAVAIEENGRTR